MDKLVYVGYFSGVFGLKGELKFKCESNHLDLICKNNNTLYINGKGYNVKNCRFHKDSYLITLEGYEDINKINDFLKQEVFINKEEIGLTNEDYLSSELVNLSIEDNGDMIGVVEEVLYNKNNLFIKTGNLIVPLIDKYYVGVNIKKGVIYIKNSKELVL